MSPTKNGSGLQCVSRAWRVIVCILAVMVAAGCGGGGGSAAAPEPTTTEVPIEQLGVSLSALPSGAAAWRVLTDRTGSIEIGMLPPAGASASDFTWSVVNDVATAFTISATSTGVEVSVDGSKAAAGAKLTSALKLTRTSTRQHAIIPLAADVVALVERKTVQVGGSGASVTTAAGQVLFSSLASGSVGAEVSVAAAGEGLYQLEIRLDRDVGAAEIEVTLPTIAEPTSLSGVTAGRTGDRKSRLAVPAECAVLADGSYSNGRLGDEVLQRTSWFWRSTRAKDSARPRLTGVRRLLILTQGQASRLEAAVSRAAGCPNGPAGSVLEAVDWTQFEPVLFVHGYNLGGPISGGNGTWAQFPKLARNTPLPGGLRPFPFEFRWATDAGFKTVASDLGRTINFIRSKTGKPVHVVAHSFGGIVLRTLLQGMAPDIPQDQFGNMREAQAAVASATTLGTPHSGATAGDVSVTTSAGRVDLPHGADLLVRGCMQISCLQMGESSIWGVSNGRLLGYSAEDLTAGVTAAELFQTREQLPNIPIHVGIGLTVDNGLYTAGDRLIRFAGQRFLPRALEIEANAAQLLKQQAVGQATVTEFVLGASKYARPGIPASQVIAGSRQNGYVHVAGLALSSDGGFANLGAEVAPQSDCATYLTCTHAGYLLFRQIVRDAVDLRLSSTYSPPQVGATPLALNPARLGAVGPDDHRVLQGLLSELMPYVSAGRVRWDLVPSDLLTRTNAATARIFGDSAAVQDIKAQYALIGGDLGDYNLQLVRSQNAFVVLDAQNVTRLIQIIASATKAAAAVAKVAGPSTALVIFPIPRNVRFHDLDRYNNVITLARALAASAEFGELVGTCASTLSTLAEYIDSVGGQDMDASRLATLAIEVGKCVTNGLADDSQGYSKTFQTIMKLTASTLEIDGTPVKFWVAFSGMLSSILDVLPPFPGSNFLQSAADVANSMASAIEVGKELSNHTNEVVSLREEQVQAVVELLSLQLNADRSQLLAAARTVDLFIEGSATLGSLTYSPQSPTVGQATSWTVSSVIDAIRTVVWRFGTSVAEFTAEVVGGVSNAVSKVWDAVGTFDVVASFRNGLGTVLGTQVTTVQVAPAVTTVVAVTPLTARAGTEVLFTVAGSNLTSGMGFLVQDCTGVAEVDAANASTVSRQFRCTFPADTLAGQKDGAIALAGQSGSPFSSPLFTFRVDVTAAAGSSSGVVLFDDFLGSSIDASKWNIVGQPSIAGGVTQYPALSRINTQGKVTIAGNRIVIEARLAGQGNSRDTSIQLVDTVSGDFIYSGDTSYFGWGFFANGSGAYNFVEVERPAGVGAAPQNCTALGGSTNQFMEYRWTLEGNVITFERGPTLGNITQRATRTLGRSIAGRSFYLSVGTAGASYSPGTWDWVRVRTDSLSLIESDTSWRLKLYISRVDSSGNYGSFEYSGLSCGGSITYQGT